MKICHLTSVHPRYDVRIYKECISLLKVSSQISIIVADGKGYEFTKDGIHVYDAGYTNSRIKRIIFKTKQILKLSIKLDADVYHFHDPELLTIGLKLKKRGKKVIFDSHEFYREQLKGKEYIPKFLRIILSHLYAQYEKFVCSRIDGVIQVCTLSGKNYFENRAKKTEFISNAPVYQDFLNYTNKEFKSKDSVVYVGSLSYYRGITHIVKAAKIANTKLILGGNFNSKNYQSELIKIKEFSNVDFRGYVSKDEMSSIFYQSFAGLSTLLHINQYDKIDTLPTKVYDYMAAGLPVILSNTKFAVDIINKYQFGLVVNPENIEEIVNAITYLKNNKELAKQLGENGRKAFEEKFNWQIEEKKLISLYNSL